MKKIPTIPLSQLIKELQNIETLTKGKDIQVSFSGLTFDRLKISADNTLQIQFQENIDMVTKTIDN